MRATQLYWKHNGETV